MNTTPIAAPTSTPAVASVASTAVAASSTVTLPAAGGITPSFLTGPGVPAGTTLGASVATYGGIPTSSTGRRAAEAAALSYSNTVCLNSILVGIYAYYNAPITVPDAFKNVSATLPSDALAFFSQFTVFATLYDTGLTQTTGAPPPPPCAIGSNWSVVQTVNGAVAASGLIATFGGQTVLKANEIYYVAVSMGGPAPSPGPSAAPTATASPTAAPTATASPTAAPTAQATANGDIGTGLNEFPIPAISGVLAGSNISAPGATASTTQLLAMADGTSNFANLPAIGTKQAILYITGTLSSGGSVVLQSTTGFFLTIDGTIVTSGSVYAAQYTLNGVVLGTTQTATATTNGPNAELNISSDPLSGITLHAGDKLGVVIAHN